MFKDSDPTTKKTQHFYITKISWLMLFREINSVYSQTKSKPINTLRMQKAELLNTKPGGTCRYKEL